MPSAYPRIDFHNVDLSLVLDDVGLAMEKIRKAHRPNVLANALRLYDMFTAAMTQQALLLDQTSECSCASATSCCDCGRADDEASLTSCATCMMNYHKECVETFVQHVVGLANVLLCRQLFSSARFVKCVWQRTWSTLLTRDRCSVGKMPKEKE